MHKRSALGLFIGALLVGAMPGCASTGGGPDAAESVDAGLARLADWMTGSFSSAAQAARDDQYYDIRLEAVEIWPTRDENAVWLYVEQATGEAADRPYRQRVYRLMQTGTNQFESAVFELPSNPLAFAGWWQSPQRFDRIGPEALAELEGCAMRVTYDASRGVYTGATATGTCPSSLRGAAYVMSDVTIGPDTLVSWDRGFDAEHEQVWGATEGGYEFIRIR